jgi:hypothetical protein
MSNSYRIRTELGINKSINVQLDQEFEFLEILSLKLQQEDIYIRACADYGVVVGRITANNGFGIPNARVSIFIPIDSIDQSNPLISSIYPYKSPTDKNEDGYRYNLLPYEKSYSKHAATGTLPTRLDALTGQTAIEIYNKYYKYTTKTNESGDYMIMGAPLGFQTVFMDVDLSDIGDFSLTPQDLIRMGLATEGQVAGNKFRTSNNLKSLPQIISLSKSIEVSPLWGEPQICDIAINRVDFDLRDEANVDIQPTSIFMGSIMSTSDKFRVRKNCKPKDNMGNLCALQSGPGQILALRQTIQQDSDGNPVLEQYELEQAGNVIDGDGTWLTELPMNMDYVVTNEFGEKVLSNNPNIGIPTKAKYRFKIKWQQPNNFSDSTKRAYFLVPNVKEYGWEGGTDPNNVDFNSPTSANHQKMISSYYFGLAWSGYTNGSVGTAKLQRLNEAIDCEDTFYEFKYNRVYTVSGLIDEYKKGAKGRFIGIKEIDSDECASTINKFPVNEGFRNFDLLFFIFSILLTILQPIGLVVLTLAHILIWLRNLIINIICAICGISIFGIHPFGFICRVFNINCNKQDYTIRLPMITYPDCEACSCSQDLQTRPDPNTTIPSGSLSYVSSPESYNENFQMYFSGENESDISIYSDIYSQSIGGRLDSKTNINIYKTLKSKEVRKESDNKLTFTYSTDLPLGERINLFNQRSNYFAGLNKIKITLAKDLNNGKYHYDNTITVLSNQTYSSGDLLTFVNPATTSDINYLYSASTLSGITTGISGSTYNGSNATTINVTYALTQLTDNTIVYNLPYGSTEVNYKFPQDREYFQVVTAMTVSQAASMWNTSLKQSFPDLIKSTSKITRAQDNFGYYDEYKTLEFNASDYFTDFNNQIILVLQRGVDPYSPKYMNEYSVGTIFGSDDNDSKFIFTAMTRVNIPIQKLPNSSISVQSFSSQDDMFYQSYFFKPGIDGDINNGFQYSAYTSSTIGYYGSLDAINRNNVGRVSSINGVNSVITNTNNKFYSSGQDSLKYDNSEDLSSGGEMYSELSYSWFPKYNSFINRYVSQSLYPSLLSNPMLISYGPKNVMRTDRLPSSDGLDGGSWSINPAMLQQNLNFSIYLLNTDSIDFISTSFSSGADQVTPDLGGLPNAITVLESFNCESMVGLECYQGIGSNFQINQDCTKNDEVEKGCYLFMRRPLVDLFKDIGSFAQWGFRFRFFYGLCRGVLSQSFTNNWVNGVLYTFPIQVDTTFNNQNQPNDPKYCHDVVVFDKNTNNFFYRSSPYNSNTKKFVGLNQDNGTSVNKKNLLFPTTIINLGIKDYFYQEITFDPSTKGYIMNQLNTSSYGDTSDLVNLFVISRITDEGFLRQIINIGDNSLNQLFSRTDYKRVDGDLAQLMSINSESGVVKFSPEFYEIQTGTTYNPTNVLGTPNNPFISVFFSSTTNDLQFKDYLTPGRINFRANDNSNYLPYPYGIKSQVVPFYQWSLASGTNTIFGGQYNNWKTDTRDIVQNQRYQSLDRTNLTSPGYFIGSNTQVSDLYERGYIFNIDFCVSGITSGNYSYTDCSGFTHNGNGVKTVEFVLHQPHSNVTQIPNIPTDKIVYSVNSGNYPNKFMVGAPFHFYFGIINGASALDKFKTKYSVDE